MVKCNFCGKDIEKGTGTMLVKTDGRIHYFCSTKCEKNLLKLKRKPREYKWTQESRAARGKKATSDSGPVQEESGKAKRKEKKAQK
jgi:large subunit ribosomal protein L24e